MIGYYVHHHGFGHLARAISICAHVHQPVTALSSLDIAGPHPFADVVRLPRDDDPQWPCEPTANGALHWAPLHHSGFQARMDIIARWVTAQRPQAIVTDVSVEVAAFVRLLGIPVIVMTLPGRRLDAPHLLAHRLADHIVAAWPKELCVPPWLRPYADKTSYVGGISRFEGRQCPSGDDGCTDGSSAPRRTRVLVLGGAEETFGAGVDEWMQACPGTRWTHLGGGAGSWVDDPWPQLCAADVVVTHAGQSAIADIAAAKRPALVIPQPRPFDEQQATATVLRRCRLATVMQGVPDVRAWPALLAHAQDTAPGRWARWKVDGAAARAAAAIESTAQRHSPTAVTL